MTAIVSSPSSSDTPSATTVATLGHALVDAFNRGSFEHWSARLASDYRADYPGASGLDATAARAFNEVFVRAFSNLHFAIEQEWTVGDTHIAVWSAGGTHDGILNLPTVSLPPTGRTGYVQGTIITTTRDDLIVYERTYWNQLELMTQLGIGREYRPMN